MEATSENILNVSALPSQAKHPTIFSRFDELSGGEHLIIHNDHDPKPLYYHLQGERGDSFSWEYLESGPELFRIKITKNKESLTGQEEVEKISAPGNTVSGNEKENILNVSLIEPKLKHPTIFVRFDELVAGESLTIHNDHDPKPLYYQLLGERGNIFSWEYLQEGPDLWRVKISKKLSGEDDETLGEIAAKDLRKAEVFKKYGLDFCCGGKKTVKQACSEKGLDVTKIEQELQAADKNVSTARPVPYNDWSLDFLADYIINTHHSYVRKSLPDLRSYSVKVASVHGDNHPELLEISKLVEEISQELSSHLVSEETILFPYVKHLVAAKNNAATTVSFRDYDSIKTQIELLEVEHESVGKSLETIRELSDNYSLPEDSCASYSYLFNKLDEFENDLHIHIHLENNILFPKAIELEKEIN